MINDEEKKRIERCVVQIECISKTNDKDKELGTGFFVEKNIIVTASHVVDKYYTDPLDYFINVIPINANIDRDIKVINLIENERNNFVSILELEEDVENIDPLKFTLGYTIKRDDRYFTFGHPQGKRMVGYPVENKVATTINENQSKKANWDLNLTLERLEDFKGLSGSPIIINNMLVGIVQTESDAKGKAISIGMSSVEIMKKFIPYKYCREYDDIFHIQKLGYIDQKKIFTIDDMDKKLKESTEPSISLDFFEIDDEEFKETFRKELDRNIYVVGKSREETLYCILNELKYNTNYNKVVIAGDKDTWEYLRNKISGAILIPDFYVGEIISIKNNINIFIYGEDEHCTKQKRIELKRRTRRTIINKLEKAGLDSQVAYNYVENTNGLFVPLKRKLFNGQYNISPVWYREKSDSFVTALLCGKWTECQGDKDVIEELSGKSYDEFMNDLLPFIKGAEPFVIEILDYGKKIYQLANIEIAWEYLDERIQKQIWDKFIALAYKVITKMDPIFYKPFEEHYKASFYTEKPENSNVLKLGIIRSLIFRGIYRESQYQYEIDKIVKDMLISIDSVERWGYFSQFFTELCEASPKSVLERLEIELINPTGLRELFNANSKDMFTARNYYTHVLWTVEQLLLHKEYVVRAVKWLFAIDNMNLKYSISNSPGSTLSDVFCAWYNISVLTAKEKIVLSNYAIKKYENAWNLIFNELPGKHQVVHGSGNKPKYREFNEIEQVTNADVYNLYNEYAMLCINNINNDIDKWIKITNEFSIFPDEMLDNLLSKLAQELDKMSDCNKRIIKDGLRSAIYRHRYSPKSTWAMDEKRLQKLEKLCILIEFHDKVYDYLYLFKNSFDMPILHPIPYDKENKTTRDENKKLKEAEIEDRLKGFKISNLDLTHLIELLDVENYNNFGMYLAKYYTDGKFDANIYKKMIDIKSIEQIMWSYVSWIYRNGDKSVINQAKSLSKNYDSKDVLYVNILKIEDLIYKDHPHIMNEDEHIKQLYWSEQIRRFAISNDKDTLQWVLKELKNYNNMIGYIECLYEGLKIFESEELLQYMIDLKEFNTIKRIDQMTDYYIDEIMDIIASNFEGQYDKYYEIMSVEMFFRGIIEWEKMKCTQHIFKKNPDFYAQIIDLIYLHEGEKKGSRTTEQSNISQNLFGFYYKALFCPCENNGDIDLNELKEWVKNFKDKLDEQKQSKLLGDELGRLFAYSPVGNDGYYPHESVREIIEELADERLRNSYVITERNKRGVYSPDAGKTEKEIALKYKENADQIRILYSESAKIYDELYKSYYYDSEAERRRAEDEW
ncbi:trypsin-like peptidase domain-containing protein [Clostridium botulinum]|nr:trypsin-like peptidase domain-containing protein [Clostridium botulinum]